MTDTTIKLADTTQPSALAALKIGPLPIVPQRAAPGRWTADPVLLPMPGDWRLRLTVRTSDIDQTTVDKNVKIG